MMRNYIVISLLLIAACSGENNHNSLDNDEGNMPDALKDTTGIWDDNSVSIQISEFSWIEYDVGFYKSFVERTREELSSTSLQLLSELHGDGIVGSIPRCPEEYKNSTDASIFSILILQSDTTPRWAAAANVDLCGFNGANTTLLEFESVEALHNSIGVDW